MSFVQPRADAPAANTTLIAPPIAGRAPGGSNTAPGIPALVPDGFSDRRATVPPDPSLGPAFAGFGLDGSWGSGSGGGFFGVMNGLLDRINTLLAGFTNEMNAEGPGRADVADGTFSSTGDPHLSEKATVLGTGGTSSVERHFDSMTGHDNLLSSQDFDGGYRLSTTVTAPNDRGVTSNASATVHGNGGNDAVTLRNDGTVVISSDGSAVGIDAGQSVTLAGGETVSRGTDGSLTVAVTNIYGGTITTALTAKNGGVDATATVHNATVGGDITATADPASRA